ncbi:hypothetical protein CBR_g4194 [Chara braunii]|uniref:Calmodulin n=1 Tax=Chara braunii TaxID=69332 RepID=A0A388KHI3_CHABU|nr:hypothetical protein CBR_g4194 [Chara braunii]|eukprot:GBG69501.1 hypothetical protein CBR_g4194 [Chara braunii]
MDDPWETVFQLADLDHDGKINGQEAVKFFPRVNLPQSVLAQIWSFADRHQNGFLTKPEFFTALQLATVAQAGQQVTKEVAQAVISGAIKNIKPPRLVGITIPAFPPKESSPVVPPTAGAEEYGTPAPGVSTMGLGVLCTTTTTSRSGARGQSDSSRAQGAIDGEIRSAAHGRHDGGAGVETSAPSGMNGGSTMTERDIRYGGGPNLTRISEPKAVAMGVAHGGGNGWAPGVQQTSTQVKPAGKESAAPPAVIASQLEQQQPVRNGHKVITAMPQNGVSVNSAPGSVGVAGRDDGFHSMDVSGVKGRRETRRRKGSPGGSSLLKAVLTHNLSPSRSPRRSTKAKQPEAATGIASDFTNIPVADGRTHVLVPSMSPETDKRSKSAPQSPTRSLLRDLDSPESVQMGGSNIGRVEGTATIRNSQTVPSNLDSLLGSTQSSSHVESQSTVRHSDSVSLTKKIASVNSSSLPSGESRGSAAADVQQQTWIALGGQGTSREGSVGTCRAGIGGTEPCPASAGVEFTSSGDDFAGGASHSKPVREAAASREGTAGLSEWTSASDPAAMLGSAVDVHQSSGSSGGPTVVHIFEGDGFPAAPSSGTSSEKVDSASDANLKKSHSSPSLADGRHVFELNMPASLSMDARLQSEPTAGQGGLTPARGMTHQSELKGAPGLGLPASEVGGSAITPGGWQPTLVVMLGWPQMTAVDEQRYLKIYSSLGPDHNGMISGQKAKDLLMSSQLPREVLKHVWDLADEDEDGMLTSKEFCIALYLVERAREGRSLPLTLPSGIHHDDSPFHPRHQVVVNTQIAEAHTSTSTGLANAKKPSQETGPPTQTAVPRDGMRSALNQAAANTQEQPRLLAQQQQQDHKQQQQEDFGQQQRIEITQAPSREDLRRSMLQHTENAAEGLLTPGAVRLASNDFSRQELGSFLNIASANVNSVGMALPRVNGITPGSVAQHIPAVYQPNLSSAPETHLANQLGRNDHEALATRHNEMEELSTSTRQKNQPTSVKKRADYYEEKMQEIVLFKRRCWDKLVQIEGQIEQEKRDVAVLARNYDEKFRQTEAANLQALAFEARLKSLAKQKIALQDSINHLHNPTDSKSSLQARVNQLVSELDELRSDVMLRVMRSRLKVKAAPPVESTCGWQFETGMQGNTCEWEGEWAYFKNEGLISAVDDIEDRSVSIVETGTCAVRTDSFGVTPRLHNNWRSVPSSTPLPWRETLPQAGMDPVQGWMRFWTSARAEATLARKDLGEKVALRCLGHPQIHACSHRGRHLQDTTRLW